MEKAGGIYTEKWIKHLKITTCNWVSTFFIDANYCMTRFGIQIRSNRFTGRKIGKIGREKMRYLKEQSEEQRKTDGGSHK